MGDKSFLARPCPKRLIIPISRSDGDFLAKVGWRPVAQKRAYGRVDKGFLNEIVLAKPGLAD
jgi:hypothetical protein